METAKTRWVPAMNNEAMFGWRAFLEIDGNNWNKAMRTTRRKPNPAPVP